METTGITHMTTNKTQGTLRWQAPELLPIMADFDNPDVKQYNTPDTDVYAFAMVCYEVSQIPTYLRACEYLAADVFWQYSIPQH